MTSLAPTSILIVGSGGREQALASRLAMEGMPRVSVVAFPADGGTEDRAILQAIAATEADLVVVGPEAPLVGGLADRLAARWIPVFGPTAAAARLEGSKAFCREVVAAAGVPMADGATFDDIDAAVAFARRLGDAGSVVKADGLAGGKGVTVCDTPAEAERAIRECRRRFGAAAEWIVVEERLDGREVSVIAICDGETAVPLPPARDHKRVGEGDTGPNTGGMGAYSPVEDFDDADAAGIVERFHRPVLRALAERGTPFRGALYAGIMLTADGPRLLEFNVRFGDPETQAILPRVDLPLGRVLRAAAMGQLRSTIQELELKDAVPAAPWATVAVVIAAEGYPGATRRGDPIDVDREGWPEKALLHWGAVDLGGADGRVTTDGGRVATAVGTGPTLERAAAVAYEVASRVRFPGAFYRRDIGPAAWRSPLAVASAAR